MVRIRPSRPDDFPRTLDIWRAAVRATHDFLTPEDFDEIEGIVIGFLPEEPALIAVDEDDWPLGFLVMDETHVDALFIDPAVRGQGIGKALIAHVAALHDHLTVDVNEQNEQAVGFYERLGFVGNGWSATDDSGRPYPVIYMRRG